MLSLVKKFEANVMILNVLLIVPEYLFMTPSTMNAVAVSMWRAFIAKKEIPVATT